MNCQICYPTTIVSNQCINKSLSFELATGFLNSNINRIYKYIKSLKFSIYMHFIYYNKNYLLVLKKN